MFGYNPEVNDLKNKVSSLENELAKAEKAHTEKVEKLERQLKNDREDHAITLSRKTESVESAVLKATKELNATIQTLTIEKNKFEQEAAILKKAFENLGFDVKDMKDILNKLVDGIVSKNQIQLINGNK